jgi:phospholipid/cholesterol/gamma-HCH transport system permease protein
MEKRTVIHIRARRHWFRRFIITSGDVFLRLFDNFAAMFLFALTSVVSCFRQDHLRQHSFLSQLSRQILYTGVEAFWLISVIAFICGSTIVIQAMTNMPKFGITEYFGNILIISVVRELGPFFTAIVVVGRSGAALAAHIGTMRVNKEVSALEVMGIDPIQFLVVPALYGLIASTLCLIIYFDLIAIVGGLVAANFFVEIPFWIFMMKVFDALTVLDIIIPLFKGFLFGGVIAILSTWYGLNVKNIRGVPQAAINAVVGSMALSIICNVTVTILCQILLY